MSTDDSALHPPRNTTFPFPKFGDAAKELRLLRVFPPQQHGGVITCQFLKPITPELASESEGGYAALSYTSGPEEYEIIRVDEKDFEIRRNLACAIRQLIGDTPRILWIDQICINEGDESNGVVKFS
ncbi:hypothetical protein TWF696_002879 [Orbilia brochopaga]|uniref:Heterokaryon incompatibility domain-containing protein n=1 Tax=Orbilia brochopaga TaxID=3140254 RepID=A0AAV9U0Y8_9PEZI